MNQNPEREQKKKGGACPKIFLRRFEKIFLRIVIIFFLKKLYLIIKL